MRLGDRVELAVLVVDAVLLAGLEMFFLPLRFDGTALPEFSDLPAPVAVLLAWVTMPLLTRRAVTLTTRPLAPLLPLFAWLLTIGVLSFAGPGGDVMFVPGLRLLLLIGGGTVATMIVLSRATAGERTSPEQRSTSGQRGTSGVRRG